MAKNANATLVEKIIKPFDDQSPIATHDARYGRGGYRSVTSISERNSISAERRDVGMLVYVQETQLHYVLGGDLTTWTPSQIQIGLDGDSYYGSESLGLAGTSSGEFFFVADGNGLSLYYNNSGVAELRHVYLDGDEATAAAQGYANTAAVKAGESAASAIETKGLMDQVVAAADAVAVTEFADTHPQAVSAAASLPDDTKIMVFEDGDQGGLRTIYDVQSGALVGPKARLNVAEVLRGLNSMSALTGFGASIMRDGDRAEITGFYAGSSSGSGEFYWDATYDKAEANGGTIIDPDTLGGFDGTVSTRDAYLAAQGTGSGTGCWVSLAERINFARFGALGDGVQDDYLPCLRAVVDANAAGWPLDGDVGTYRLSQRIALQSLNGQSNINLRLEGAGTRRTIFMVDGSENSDGGILVQKVGTDFSCELSHFSIVAKSGSGDCGTGLEVAANIGGATLQKTLLIDHVVVSSEDFLVTDNGDGTYSPESPAYFSRPFVVTEIARAELNRCIWQGPKSNTSDNSIRYADTSASYLADTGFTLTDIYGPILTNCQAHQCKYGFDLVADENAVEGGDFADCVAVNVREGIRTFKTAESPAGTEPGLDIIGGHINYRDYGVHVKHRKRGQISDILFHMQNDETGIGAATPIDIYVEVGNSFTISNNDFTFDSGHPFRRGVQFDALGTVGETDVRSIIEGNRFDATMLYAIRNNIVDTNPDVGTNYYKSTVENKLYTSGANQRVPFTRDNFTKEYTPTITNESGCAVTPLSLTYRYDNGVVRIFGRLNVNADTANTLVSFDMSIPIATDLTNDRTAAGTITAIYSSIPDASTGVLYADPATEVLNVEIVAKSNANQFCYIDVAYRTSVA